LNYLFSEPQDSTDFHEKPFPTRYIYVFLLAQTFLKKKALPKKQGFSFCEKEKVLCKSHGIS